MDCRALLENLCLSCRKCCFTFFLLIILLLSPTAWAVYPGDINQDDEVNLEDGILAQQILSNFLPPPESDKNADVNGDDKIGLAEAIYVIRDLSQHEPVQIQERNPASGLPGTYLTVSGTGFDPEAEVAVRFFNDSGYSVMVRAIEVAETSVVASVPAFFNRESGTWGGGTVSVQVAQKVNGIIILSNEIAGFVIQSPPVPEGSLTLSFLQASADTGRQLLTDIAGTEMDTIDFHNALLNQIARIDELAANIGELISDPAKSFDLGTVTDTLIYITASDLKMSDTILLSVLLAFGDNNAMLSSAKANADCQQIESQAVAAGSSNPDLDLSPLVGELIYAPRASSNCKSAQAFLTAEKIWAGAGAAAVGLLFLAGAPEIAIALPVAGMLYVTVESAMGMIAIGGGLGQEELGAYEMVKEGVAKLETLMEFGPLKAVAPKAGAIAGIYYGARSLMEEFGKTPYPSTTTTSTTTSITTTTTSTTTTSIPVSAAGTYTGAFTGVLTETIDCAQWRHDISATIVITLTGSGSLIDPYSGEMTIEGSADSTGTYCNCEYGCDLGPGEHDIFSFSDTGEVSGSQGKVVADTSGEVGTGTFDASFTDGTISGNTLTGTLTFGSEGLDAPIVKTIILIK